MMVVMSPQATPEQIEHVIERVKAEGFSVHRSDGKENTVIGCVGHLNIDAVDPRQFELLPGARKVSAELFWTRLEKRVELPEKSTTFAAKAGERYRCVVDVNEQTHDWALAVVPESQGSWKSRTFHGARSWKTSSAWRRSAASAAPRRSWCAPTSRTSANARRWSPERTSRSDASTCSSTMPA
jgi:hypothetical protein